MGGKGGGRERDSKREHAKEREREKERSKLERLRECDGAESGESEVTIRESIQHLQTH